MQSLLFGSNWESSDIGAPCSTPSWNWFSKCFAKINETLCLSAMTCLNSSCPISLECCRRCNRRTALDIGGPLCKRSISLARSPALAYFVPNLTASFP